MSDDREDPPKSPASLPPTRFRADFITDELVELFTKPVQLPPSSGTWISARDAQTLVELETGVSPREAQSALCRRALNWVRVKASVWSRGEEPHEYIDRRRWREEHAKPDLSHFSDAPTQVAWGEMLDFFETIDRNLPEPTEPEVSVCCWATGDFSICLERDFSDVTIKIVGLMFDRDGVLESIGSGPSGDSETIFLPHRAKPAGGRPAASHGDAMAAVTLALAALPAERLARVTAKDVSADLAAEYRRLGEAAPSAENRSKYAAGILRAVRGDSVL